MFAGSQLVHVCNFLFVFSAGCNGKIKNINSSLMLLTQVPQKDPISKKFNWLFSLIVILTWFLKAYCNYHQLFRASFFYIWKDTFEGAHYKDDFDLETSILNWILYQIFMRFTNPKMTIENSAIVKSNILHIWSMFE